MSKPNPSDPFPPVGNVNDDTWTRILTAAVDSDRGEQWICNAVANAEMARHN